MDISRLDQIDGIQVGSDAAIDLVKNSVELAVSVALASSKTNRLRFQAASARLHRLAMAPALQTANALMSAAAAQCTVDPPPADIEIVPDTDGTLIYQCVHQDPHKWKLDGTRI